MYGCKISYNVDLANLHTFALPARANALYQIYDQEGLDTFLEKNKQVDVPVMILSAGSNTIFLNDFAGIVVQPMHNFISVISEDEFGIEFEVGAGVNWHQFVGYCVRSGFHGLENLALIPGSVGAAPFQNIGAYGVSLSDYLTEVKGVWLNSGETKSMSLSDCQFGYRDSIFKTADYKNKFLITSIKLRLSKEPVVNITHKDVKKQMADQEKTPINLYNTIIRIRQAKLPDPDNIPNAGSFFKNPIIDEAKFCAIKKKYPNISFYRHQNQIKIPAAWLIEYCGWKGRRLGHVGVYEGHALVLIQDRLASPDELVKLLALIQKSVDQTFGIKLEPEVVLVNEMSPCTLKLVEETA